MSNIDDSEQIEQAAEKIMGILTRDEPRKSFDGYAHPNTKERAKRGISAIKTDLGPAPTDKESLTVPNTIDQVVLSAKGKEVMAAQYGDESLLTKAVMPPLTDFKTCTQCGNLFLEYKHGNTKPNKCKECVKANISDSIRIKNIKKKFEADADQYAKDHPENLTFDDDPPPMLTLMFSQKRDARVYEAICASAENDRRTPENQVLHFLEMAFNGFGADVTFALEGTINREEN